MRDAAVSTYLHYLWIETLSENPNVIYVALRVPRSSRPGDLAKPPRQPAQAIGALALR